MLWDFLAQTQMSKGSLDAASLVGAALRVNLSQSTWLGGYRTGAGAASGWSWVDSTNASNLNCDSSSCEVWGVGEPSNVGGEEDRLVGGLDFGDISAAATSVLSFTCELEACPPGQYLGPSFSSGCTPCPVTTFSEGGAVDVCTACPAGVYGSVTGLANSSCSGNCTAGYICPMGSINATGFVCSVGKYSAGGVGSCSNCSAGRFGNSSGLPSAGCSGLCPAGRFGSTSGMSAPLCEGACTAGYACPAGSVNATSAVCAAGLYSFVGAGVCTACQAGLYGSVVGWTSASCRPPVGIGWFCPMPIGRYLCVGFM
jgi:hypothetical protein